MKENGEKQWLVLPKFGNKKGVPSFLIWCVIGAVVFLLLSGGGEKSTKESKKESEVSETVSSLDYVKQLEEKLAKSLEQIQGAGKVTVFLTLENSGKKILATDSVHKVLEDETYDLQMERQTEAEESVVLSEEDAGQTPYIVEEKFPVPSGVLVIAQGAGEERVRMEIYEAVKALFGLSANRIKVSY